MQLTAPATFDSSLDGSLLDCYALAGLKVPPNGPLTGFRIAWAVDQAIADYPDFGYPGSPDPYPLMQQGKYLAVARVGAGGR